jgi:hypothetical protein
VVNAVNRRYQPGSFTGVNRVLPPPGGTAAEEGKYNELHAGKSKKRTQKEVENKARGGEAHVTAGVERRARGSAVEKHVPGAHASIEVSNFIAWKPGHFDSRR